ncbi:MAG: cell division FtsZ family protein, partial [Bacteroidales bacterium]|nr:cell division FtsZ family protein [Bacteroidales bacterium]
DSKTLERVSGPNQIRIGDGLGAGTKPEVGKKYAIEDRTRIEEALIDSVTKMVFVTASLGGGTGTGAAPIVADICKQAGILTVGVVTLPFATEGKSARMKALDGLDAMRMAVDSLIVIDNNRLYSCYGGLSIWEAFHKADEVLSTAVEGILGIIEKTGYINVDLNDVQTMMRDSGMALMGCGSGSGENRVNDAIQKAIESPLLNNYDLKKATKVLVNVTCSASNQGLKMEELSLLEHKIGECLGITDNYKKGIVFDEDPEFGDRLDVTIIATGVQMMGAVPEDYFEQERVVEKPVVNDDNAPEPASEFIEELEIKSPEIESPTPAPATERHQKENGASSGTSKQEVDTGKTSPVIIRVVSRIKDGVAKLYDDME